MSFEGYVDVALCVRVQFRPLEMVYVLPKPKPKADAYVAQFSCAPYGIISMSECTQNQRNLSVQE